MTIRCIEAGSMTGFLIAAVDDGPDAAVRLIIRCPRCDTEETMNDEEGTCWLSEMTAWAQKHERGRHPAT